jgi:hypothetical protein
LQIRSLGGCDAYAELLQDVLVKLVDVTAGKASHKTLATEGTTSASDGTARCLPQAYKIQDFCIDAHWQQSKLRPA